MKLQGQVLPQAEKPRAAEETLGWDKLIINCPLWLGGIFFEVFPSQNKSLNRVASLPQ